MSTVKKIIRIARIEHWVKNIFIIPGIIFAIFLTNDVTFSIWKTALAIFSTCLVASANYIINEYLDRDFDQYHPIKKERVLVTSEIKAVYIFIGYFTFLIIGCSIAWYVNKYVFLMELWLLVMGILYNVKPIRTKDIPVIDVLTESINNIIRLLIGWFVITTEYLPPVSIVLFYWFIGAFLMNTKRYAEYMSIHDKKMAGLYRKSFQFYNEKRLLVMSVFYAILSIFFCGVFIVKYRIELLICIPFLSWIVCYYLSLSYNTDSAVSSPEKLYKERNLIIMIFLLICLTAILLKINIPFLSIFLTNELIKIG